jgi:hypothetical protein
VVRLESLLALVLAQNTGGFDTALKSAEHLFEALAVAQDYLHAFSFLDELSAISGQLSAYRRWLTADC